MFSKSFVFGDRKRRLRVDANPKRIKKDAFSKVSGYVWTGPQYKCDRIFDSIEGLKRFQGIEIRRRDSIIIPLMIEENRAKFFTASL